jgi:CheY-like chemotaxis protein
VLINILSNAIKFTDAPGSVTLTVERTAVFEDQSTLKFSIRDTGIGMDQEYIPKIFDAFSQEDSSRKNKYGSTGLGMAITRSIVEMMNGSISVASKKGAGSEFTVSVTLKNGESRETARTAGDCDGMEANQTDLAGRRVLLAEDMEMNAEIMMDLLSLEDIEVDHAKNGRIAADMFESSAPGTYAAILMDVRMPEMDGLEAAAAIRAMDREDAKRIPIIALTANAFDEDVQRSLQAGMNAHLSKPVDADHLIQVMGELVYEAEGRM